MKHSHASNHGGNMQTADKDYFLDKDQQLTESEADAAFLLVRKGQEISAETAAKYGIGKKKKADDADTGEEAETKAAKPSENKVKTPTKNK
jgi:hypothetical protein